MSKLAVLVAITAVVVLTQLLPQYPGWDWVELEQSQGVVVQPLVVQAVMVAVLELRQAVELVAQAVVLVVAAVALVGAVASFTERVGTE